MPSLSAVGASLYNPTIMATIEIEKLSKSYTVYQKQEGLRASLRGLFRREYRQVRAVREIDLTVEQGEFVAFLGPNGAGKTTTLKLLSGVISPSSGAARVMGHVPWQRENAYRRRFALVMGQKNQLWWDLPAQESFRLHQQIYRIDSQRFQTTLDELTALLSVAKLLQSAGSRVVAGRAHENGTDRRSAAFAGRAVPGRTHHRTRCGGTAQHSAVSEVLPAETADHDSVDQPLHEGRRRPVQTRRDHRRRTPSLRRVAQRYCGPVQRVQDRHAAAGRRAGIRAAWNGSASCWKSNLPRRGCASSAGKFRR